MKKFIISILISSMVLCTVAQAAPEITSKGAVVMDAQTGETYYEYNADEPLAPASVTKIMTVYLVYKKMDEGFLSKSTMITADKEDSDASYDPEATNVEIIEGQSYSVDEILGAILVPSACAASEMIGKYIAGSRENFAELMNKTVGELGLEAYYEDASGLSDANRISARSVAILARKLITEYPDVLNYTSRRTTVFGGKEYRTTNKMLPGEPYEYWGNDGFKTGTTTLAGCCNVSTASHDGIRMISVTLHSDSGYSRFDDSKQLLDCGFDNAYFLYGSLLATNMRLFIDGYEVPAFYYGGPAKGLYFIVEDLDDYGFDISWNPYDKTVTAYRNTHKPYNPIPMEMYRGYENGSKLFDVIRSINVTVKLVNGDKEYTFKHVYGLDGYTAVSSDELANVAKSVRWNEAYKRLEVEFN